MPATNPIKAAMRANFTTRPMSLRRINRIAATSSPAMISKLLKTASVEGPDKPQAAVVSITIGFLITELSPLTFSPKPLEKS